MSDKKIFALEELTLTPVDLRKDGFCTVNPPPPPHRSKQAFKLGNTYKPDGNEAVNLRRTEL